MEHLGFIDKVVYASVVTSILVSVFLYGYISNKTDNLQGERVEEKG